MRSFSEVNLEVNLIPVRHNNLPLAYLFIRFLIDKSPKNGFMNKFRMTDKLAVKG